MIRTQNALHIAVILLLITPSITGFSIGGFTARRTRKLSPQRDEERPSKTEIPSETIRSVNSSRRNILARSGAAALGLFGGGAPSRVFASPPDLSQYLDGPQGLKYIVLKTGDGAVKPQRVQKVKTSYTLFLNGFEEDGGKKIDSSKGLFGDKPFEFMVGTSQVIKGWDLCLMDMKEGEARRLVVPSDLGYKEKGAGGKIPGGATLYFEVELTEIGEMITLNEDQEKWLVEHPI